MFATNKIPIEFTRRRNFDNAIADHSRAALGVITSFTKQMNYLTKTL